MPFEDEQPVNQVVLYDANGNPVNVVLDDNGIYRLAVDTKIHGSDMQVDGLVGVEYGKLSVADTTYYMFIDLNGAPYHHDATGARILLGSVSGKAIKSAIGSKWSLRLGVVLAIDGTDAKIGFISAASISLRDTTRFANDLSRTATFPILVDLEQAAEEFTKLATNTGEDNITEVNTGVTLEDVFGNAITPAVGDVILRVERISGGGTLDFAYAALYLAK